MADLSQGRVDVLVGMQFGSEGKGKVVSSIAPFYGASYRVGAPNAGHTVYKDRVPFKMRQIPCAWLNPNCALFLGAGMLIDVETLRGELESLPAFVRERLYIDGNAGIIEPGDSEHEATDGMFAFNGSTTEGVGRAQARKVMRLGAKVARDVEWLHPWLTDTAKFMNRRIDEGQFILAEGTQGYGLSLNHGSFPYVTSRDVIAASLLSDAGLSPKVCGKIIGVLRTYQIRVAGNSGPMFAQELSWEDVAGRSGYEHIEERTTVTNRVRRVSELSWEVLEGACRANRPDALVVTFIDYINKDDYGKKDRESLSAKSVEFLDHVESKLGVPILGVSTGPYADQMIWDEQLLAEFYGERAVHSLTGVQ